MEKYNDKQNNSGMRIIFMIAQIMVLIVVCIFVYTSYLAVGFAINEHGVSVVMYFPVLVVLLIFPILLYKYRLLFNQGHMLTAFTWMMGTASLSIVLLYVYIAQITT